MGVFGGSISLKWWNSAAGEVKTPVRVLDSILAAGLANRDIGKETFMHIHSHTHASGAAIFFISFTLCQKAGRAHGIV